MERDATAAAVGDGTLDSRASPQEYGAHRPLREKKAGSLCNDVEVAAYDWPVAETEAEIVGTLS